jgi:hypothetical protein
VGNNFCGPIVNRAYIDVPVNATSVTFTAKRSSSTAYPSSAIRDVDLYLVPPDAGYTQSYINPANISAATYSAVTVNGTSTSSESITLTYNQLIPGRWMIIGKSKTDDPMNMRLGANFTSFSAPPNFKFGNYFNPSRSGHGVYFDKGASQWILLWYTFLEDGTPVWYQAQGPAPDNVTQGGSKWEAVLNRISRGSNSITAYNTGIAEITLLSDTSIQFSYIVSGEGGSETMTRLGSGGCASYQGSALDIAGQWYSPSSSGFGYTVDHSASNSQDIWEAFLYDNKGEPRWLFGQQSFDSSNTPTVPMYQLSGFCPICTYSAPTSQVVGNLNRSFTTTAAPDNLAGYGTIGVNATWAAPLTGTWNTSLPVGFLSDRKTCQ